MCSSDLARSNAGRNHGSVSIEEVEPPGALALPAPGNAGPRAIAPPNDATAPPSANAMASRNYSALFAAVKRLPVSNKLRGPDLRGVAGALGVPVGTDGRASLEPRVLQAINTNTKAQAVENYIRKRANNQKAQRGPARGTRAQTRRGPY